MATSSHCCRCFPPPAVPPLLQYHVVILPTFRDQHAELVQYLLQLPRLRKQRYFLTQHNPGARRAGAGRSGWPAAVRGAACLLPCITCPLTT